MLQKTALFAAGAVTVALIGGGAGVAASQITGKQIKNNTITSKDLKDNSIKFRDLRTGTQQKLRGATGAQGPRGATGPEGPEGPSGGSGANGNAAGYAGPNWSIIDRNSIGNYAADLRSGPSSTAFSTTVAPPLGVGSLGLQTGSASDKAAFGDQTDFAGNPLSGLATVKYSVFTTNENISRSTQDLPNVSIEVLTTGTGGYSSLVYNPPAESAGWSTITASGDAGASGGSYGWYYSNSTGQAGNTCTQAVYCTLAQAVAKFPNGTIQTVAISKGRDYAFTGAVDKLQINGTVYDFEPTGVTAAPAS